LDKFKIFEAEVENQHHIKIKVVKTVHGGEYYGLHTPYGQVLGPLARFLHKNGTVTQYSMSGDPQQNGVAERHNRTLMDMVRSILSYSTLPMSLWMETLKSLFIFLIEYRVSRCLKHRTKYGQAGNPHSIIYI
jgi:hypothetical protein